MVSLSATQLLALLMVGIILGLMGAGGSIITIPVLVYLFKIKPLVATSYSLFIVFFLSLIGVIRYRSNINLLKSLPFVIPSCIGVFVARNQILPKLPDNIYSIEVDKIIMLALSVLCLVAAIMIYKDRTLTKGNTSNLKMAGLGSLLGLVMGLLGTGGGFLIIPTLIIFANLEIKRAVPTSLMIIMFNSITGVLSDTIYLTINDYKFLTNILVISSVGMVIGTLINKKIDPNILRKLFSVFLFIMAVSIILIETVY